jgi:hypothetical protein
VIAIDVVPPGITAAGAGSVGFTQTTPRRVQTITILAGATARGVGIPEIAFCE